MIRTLKRIWCSWYHNWIFRKSYPGFDIYICPKCQEERIIDWSPV